MKFGHQAMTRNPLIVPVESLEVGADIAKNGLDDGLRGGVAKPSLQPNQLDHVTGVTTYLGLFI